MSLSKVLLLEANKGHGQNWVIFCFKSYLKSKVWLVGVSLTQFLFSRCIISLRALWVWHHDIAYYRRLIWQPKHGRSTASVSCLSPVREEAECLCAAWWAIQGVFTYNCFILIDSLFKFYVANVMSFIDGLFICFGFSLFTFVLCWIPGLLFIPFVPSAAREVI